MTKQIKFRIALSFFLIFLFFFALFIVRNNSKQDQEEREQPIAIWMDFHNINFTCYDESCIDPSSFIIDNLEITKSNNVVNVTYIGYESIKITNITVTNIRFEFESVGLVEASFSYKLFELGYFEILAIIPEVIQL